MRIPECPLCGSIDLWETPAGAWACHTCRTIISRPAAEEPLLRTDWLASDQISYQDRAEMFRRPVSRFCLCCGRYGGHGPHCEELLADWLRMPWGKYKDRPVSQVPTSYLEFVVRRGFGDSTTRAILADEVQRRGVRLHDWEVIGQDA